jgi:predicted enzyme related to lactoylglutathione lyase
MDVDFHEAGMPVWLELDTPDTEAATSFYAQLFGWTFSEGLGKQPHTWLASHTGQPIAAINLKPDLQRARWTTYFATDDTDKTLERETAAGGSVLTAPRSLGTAGRSTVLADQAGTRFGIWEPEQHPGFGTINAPGTFHGGELISDDVERSRTFYGHVFGWTLGDPYGPLDRRDWSHRGRPISVLLPRPPAMPLEIPPYWDVVFAVAEVQPTADRAVELDATALMPATIIEHGTIAVLADPTGAVFTVLAPTH